jgi:16S rRNA C1402 (ribose-2'-O) methylase RsmI
MTSPERTSATITQLAKAHAIGTTVSVHRAADLLQAGFMPQTLKTRPEMYAAINAQDVVYIRFNNSERLWKTFAAKVSALGFTMEIIEDYKPFGNDHPARTVNCVLSR